MTDSLRKPASPQPSRDFHCNIPILELPAEHVAVLHGYATVGTVQVATKNPGWRECPVAVAELPQFLASLPLGVSVYLSEARFRGWRRTQLLSSVNAVAGESKSEASAASRSVSAPRESPANPRTGTPVSLPARYTPYFKPGKKLRERVDHEYRGPSEAQRHAGGSEVAQVRSGQ